MNLSIILVIILVIITSAVFEEVQEFFSSKTADLISTECSSSEHPLLFLQRKDTFLYCLFYRQLVNIDIACLTKAMRSIECLILHTVKSS